MTIEIGGVVRLNSGGPKMTVLGIRPLAEVSSDWRDEGGGGCPLCGPEPRVESSEAQVIVTMMLAQQQWRTRHDAHIAFESGAAIDCCWFTDDGLYHDGAFAIEALSVVESAPST